MPRPFGKPPDFERMRETLEDARNHWRNGRIAECERCLAVLSSIANSDIGSAKPSDPIEEGTFG
jgi:hypothetical protein